MRYTATARGYLFDRLIEPGESFDYDGKPGKWMVPADKYVPPGTENEPEPTTFHEMQNAGRRKGKK